MNVFYRGRFLIIIFVAALIAWSVSDVTRAQGVVPPAPVVQSDLVPLGSCAKVVLRGSVKQP